MLNLLSSFIKLFCLFWGIIVNSIIDSSNSIISISEEITKSYVSSLELFIKNVSFIPMTLLIFVFFVVLGLYFERRNHLSSPSMSFFTPYFAKIRFFLTPSILSVFLVCWILLASFFQFYFSAIISFLLLLNLKFKSRYFSFFISFVIFSRLLWFFMPLNDIVAMTSFFRSFTCVFSLVGYLFFLRYHTFFILWISILLRLFLGIGMEDELGLRMHSGKGKLEIPTNTHPTTPPFSFLPPNHDDSKFWKRFTVLDKSLVDLEQTLSDSTIAEKPTSILSKHLYVNLTQQKPTYINSYNMLFAKNTRFNIGLLADNNGAVFLDEDFLESIKFAAYDLPLDPKRFKYGLASQRVFNEIHQINLSEADILDMQRKFTVITAISENLNQHAMLAYNQQFKALCQTLTITMNTKIESITSLSRDPQINQWHDIADRQVLLQFENGQKAVLLIDHYQPTKNQFSSASDKAKELEKTIKQKQDENNYMLIPVLCVDTSNVVPHNIKNFLKNFNNPTVKCICNEAEHIKAAIQDSSLSPEQKKIFNIAMDYRIKNMPNGGTKDDYLTITTNVVSLVDDQLLDLIKHKIGEK